MRWRRRRRRGGRGAGSPMVVAGINTPRAVWSIAEIEYYGLSGRD